MNKKAKVPFFLPSFDRNQPMTQPSASKNVFIHTDLNVSTVEVSLDSVGGKHSVFRECCSQL